MLYRPSRLASQSEIVESPTPWHRIVYAEIAQRLNSEADFPCVFARNAFKKRMLKFAFVTDLSTHSMQVLSEQMKEFVEISRGWDGTIETSYPLIAAFAADAVSGDSVAAFHEVGWNVLQRLHELDPSPWPEDIPREPSSPEWSYCFHGMALFCNMSLPIHRVRRSRNLGRHFILVINPRERFDVFAGDTESGRKIRSHIRARVTAYDGETPALQLGTYGRTSKEWLQYGLIEQNLSRNDQCPFRTKIAG